DLPTGDHAYVVCEPAHHHHVVCSRCGRSTEIDDRGIRAITKKIARRTGYRIDRHRLELFGLCKSCQKAVGSDRTARAGSPPGAGLIVSTGVGLDDCLDRRLSATGGQAPRLVLGDGIPTLTVNGEQNPHFWLDPSLVRRYYLPAIVGKLSSLDPAGKAAYEAK